MTSSLLVGAGSRSRLADESTPDETPEPETPEASGPVEEAAPDAVTPDAAEPEAAEPEPEPEPERDPVVVELLERLRAELGDAILGDADLFGTLVIRVRPDAWRGVAEFAKSALECDYLSYIAGIDWQPAPKAETEDTGDTSSPAQPSEMTFGVTGSSGRFQVLAHVESTSRHWGVTVKVDVDDESPHLASWVAVYPGADWHERETWEMYGIVFDGHPSLRHLYLPAEFEGHPGRKDFPLLARDVKPWPGLVDVEPMPGEDEPAAAEVGET
jgi:NADH-quinone oxidoreductase subunit C